MAVGTTAKNKAKIGYITEPVLYSFIALIHGFFFLWSDPRKFPTKRAASIQGIHHPLTAFKF